MKKLKKKRKLRYQTGGPITVNDPNDPRLKAYQDSLDLYDYSTKLHDFLKLKPTVERYIKYKKSLAKSHLIQSGKINPIGKTPMIEIKNENYLPPSAGNLEAISYDVGNPIYKKPVQPVVYQPKQENKSDIPKPDKKRITATRKSDNAQFPLENYYLKTREAIPVQGFEQRPYDSIMMPSGKSITKEQFIKRYGMDTWNKKYGKKQEGGSNIPALGLKQAIKRQDTQHAALKKYMPDDFGTRKRATGALSTPWIDPVDILTGAAASRLVSTGSKLAAKAPQLLEGQAAVDYLNSQRAWRPGNPIGTKADLNVLNENPYFGGVSNIPSDLRQNNIGIKQGHNWPELSGSTEIPAVRRQAQMMINKQHGYGINRPMNTRGVIDRYPIDEQPGFASHQASDPANYNSSWDWNISPSEIKKAAGEPRIEYPLDYHQKNQMGGPITHPMGQLKYPGQVTRIPSNNISMAGVNYPVLGVDNLNNQQMMQPGASYRFPGTSVTEYPVAGKMAVNKGMSQMGGGTGDHLSVFPMMMNHGGSTWNKPVCKECSGGLKDGGSSQSSFPNEMTFPDQRKGEFLSWLKDTSMDIIKRDLYNDHKKFIREFKKGGRFMGINPKHKGYCTPMTKSTCTPRRKALARTLKKHHGFHQYGGPPSLNTNDDYMMRSMESTNMHYTNPYYGSQQRFDPYSQYNNPYHPWYDYISNTGQRAQYQPSAPIKMPAQPAQYQTDPAQTPDPVTTAMDPGLNLPKNSTYDMTYNNPAPVGKMERPDWKDRWWSNPDILFAGMEGLTSVLNNIDSRKKQKHLRKTTSADWWNPLGEGNRGSYTPNYGYFKPDQMTVVEQPGNAGFGQYQEGGEVYMNDSEIENFLKCGGQLTYLD